MRFEMVPVQVVHDQHIAGKGRDRALHPGTTITAMMPHSPKWSACRSAALCLVAKAGNDRLGKQASMIRLVHDQLHTIAAHAAQHGYKIVRTYSDPAKSGLDIKSRPGLRTLIDDVLNR